MVTVVYHNPDYICFYKEDKFPDNALIIRESTFHRLYY